MGTNETYRTDHHGGLVKMEKPLDWDLPLPAKSQKVASVQLEISEIQIIQPGNGQWTNGPQSIYKLTALSWYTTGKRIEISI